MRGALSSSWLAYQLAAVAPGGHLQRQPRSPQAGRGHPDPHAHARFVRGRGWGSHSRAICLGSGARSIPMIPIPRRRFARIGGIIPTGIPVPDLPGTGMGPRPRFPSGTRVPRRPTSTRRSMARTWGRQGRKWRIEWRPLARPTSRRVKWQVCPQRDWDLVS